MRLLHGTGRWIGRLFVACLLGSALSAQAVDPTAYVAQAQFSAAKLSPSGNRLALVLHNDKGRNALAVMDLPPTKPPRVLQSYDRASVDWVHWVNDDRMILRVTEWDTQIRENGSAIFAIDHDGQDEVMLSSHSYSRGASKIRSHVLSYAWNFLEALDDGSADVIMTETKFDAMGDPSGVRLGRVNTKTGVMTPIVLGGGISLNGIAWEFDVHGTPRVVRVQSKDRDRLFVHRAAKDAWEPVWDRNVLDSDTLSPIQIEGDKDLVVGAAIGGETNGLHVLDLSKGQIDPEPLLRVARYDVDGTIVDKRAGKVVGATLTADRPTTVWFSDRVAAIQQSVDKALPDRFNHVRCGRCDSSRFFVVLSQSDRNPGEFLLYDDEKKSISPIGSVRPAIDPATQGRRSFHWIQARDGLAMPVVVTHPAGHDAKEALPAVVLVHGGPWVQGANRTWDAWAQFLAANGWRVIEPNFRGTLGLGTRHFTAGFKQWGQAMQDDLQDAVRWAAKEGLIDAKRVCIFGASYGGYAALMGPVRHPDTYRCAASFAGVTDIQLMFTSARADVTRNQLHYGMPQMIGDPDKDAAMLRANSPVERVADIKVPVLLAQGGYDRRVPKQHADDFEDAARKAGVKIERLDYPFEGHGFVELESQVDFMNRLAAFLKRSLEP
ncbi:alpha/beta hydrolase family protein [Rubrivivax gelatinosus]|uniref:Peptidase S9 family protein n=1 Tax=Rubrivivax gelatinosus (strain NBRC 100245 / IL144) TaxID=983917 RepID=I0HX14_RUBGI|nr:alpha/beta fold hydrolase [Rubrivivax gelatinosus]MBG6079484.1 dipeptidyl aminopeptidase/acylaminoacyl peptidase [Rubrivivax gelatinosus]BAL97551.1 peptidase S9 family protein [Rubrivivax gelatinosus IL144]